MMNLSEMGQRIKNRRKYLKFTRERLAEMVDISPQFLYEIERGSKAVSVHTLTRLVKELSISSDYILFGEECISSMDELIGIINPLYKATKSLNAEQKVRLLEIIEVIIPNLQS